MAYKTVVDFEARWSVAQDEGKIMLRLEGGTKKTLSPSSSAEFIAVLTLLQGQKAIFASPEGLLTTSP